MNRRILAFGALGAVLVVVLWYFFLWSPRNDDLEAAKERRTTAEQQASDLQARIERLRSRQQDEPARRAQLEKLRAAIPDDPNLAQFILDVNDAATRSGINFVSIAPSLPTAAAAPGATGAAGTTATTAPAGAAPAGAAPAQITAALQIQGGYYQVLDFLNRLSQLPRIVVTDSINVGGGQTGTLSVSMSTRIFVRAVPAGFTPGGAPGTATTTTTAAGGVTTTTTAAGGAATTTTTTRPTTAGAQP